MNPDPSNCPQCGSALAADSPEGLCPSCLLGGVMAPTEPSVPEPAPSLKAVASAFPNLEIDSLIGYGGMGAVYKAWQPHLERWVALKVLSTSLSSDQAFADRFTREARVLAKLNHPNIVTLHDFGQAGDYFFLLMEYVDGVNLRQAMRAGKFTSEQALGVVPKICEALQYAHSEGILHRDIKPDNVLLDSRGHLKIADVGIAKVVGTDGDLLATSSLGESALTHASTSLGTPQYMAPEQVTDPNKVDHRADIYSLGVVFYEMLTGELPTGKFVPPSQVSQVDGRIDAVVQRALEQERDERQQSADEVRTQVETIVQTPPPVPAPTRRKRRLGAGWAASFIVLGLLVPLLAVLWVRFQMVESMQAQAESEQALAMLEVAEQAMEDIQSQLTNVTNPAEIAELTREYMRTESEGDRAKNLLAEHGLPTNSRVKPSVSFLMLLVISLPFLLMGTWKGWAHLKDIRAGHAERSAGSAMFAALFLPLILLFGAVFALIYIPASDAQGAWRSAGTSLAFIAAIGACFWLVRRTWRWTHRIEGASRSIGAMGCVIAIVILGMVSVPVALFLYWKVAASERVPFFAPSSASVSNGAGSAYCVYSRSQMQFILYYKGNFRTTNSGYSDETNRSWENDGTLQLPNERTIVFYRNSGDPDSLRLNGRVYGLNEGRVFLVNDDANIEQLAFPAGVVVNHSDLDRFERNLNR